MLAGLAGCAGSDLALHVADVRAELATARNKGAYHCAPRELASGEANVEFAAREFDKGEYFSARDYLESAQTAATEALRLSADEQLCPKQPPVVRPRRPEPAPDPLADADGDGILDPYLVGKGISSDRMESKGYGPLQPIDNNTTSAGRERNRRVEFMITQQ